MGWLSWTFFHFFLENELFTENLKRGSAVTSRTVEWFNLHSFLRISFYFSSYTFFLQKKWIFAKKLKFQTAYFFHNTKIKKSSLLLCRSQYSASFDTNISPLAQKLWEFGSLEVAKLKLFRKATFLQIFLKYWWIVEPPLHTSHSYKSPQQHPLHIDTSFETFFFNFVIFCLYGFLNVKVGVWALYLSSS